MDEQQGTGVENGKAEPIPSGHRSRTKRLLGWTSALVLLAAAFAGGWYYWRQQILYPSTNDAYLRAHVVHIAPRISGRILTIAAKSYTTVKNGDVLFRIDPEPFRIAVERAEARLALARQQARASESAVDAARAVVAEREAALKDARAQSARTLALVKSGTLSKARGDTAVANLKEVEAALNGARASLRRALRELGDVGLHNANVRVAQAEVDDARRRLGYTTIAAPATGVVGDVSLRAGDTVQAGRPLFPLVEDGEWWVSANFKETDLQRIRPGQSAKVTVDLYPGRTLSGTVDSLSPASGAAFSLLPPENATGNWVKVTQRFPVRVRLDGAASGSPLRIGASTTVTIDTTPLHE